MARTWKIRPSEFFGITDEYAAYCLDKAVGFWGLAYEADINGATSKAKTDSDARRAMRQVQQRWLDDSELEPTSPAPDIPAQPTKFRDPMNTFKKAREQRG